MARLRALMSPASRPIHSGATMVSSAALVAGIAACPKASPQPTRPSSVSTFTTRNLEMVPGLAREQRMRPAHVEGKRDNKAFDRGDQHANPAKRIRSDTVAACCAFCNRSGQNLRNKIYQVGGNRPLRADAVSDGLPTSQFVARSSRTCGGKFVRSDAKQFRSRIGPQQKPPWLCAMSAAGRPRRLRCLRSKGANS